MMTNSSDCHQNTNNNTVNVTATGGEGGTASFQSSASQTVLSRTCRRPVPDTDEDLSTESRALRYTIESQLSGSELSANVVKLWQYLAIGRTGLEIERYNWRMKQVQLDIEADDANSYFSFIDTSAFDEHPANGDDDAGSYSLMPQDERVISVYGKHVNLIMSKYKDNLPFKSIDYLWRTNYSSSARLDAKLIMRRFRGLQAAIRNSMTSSWYAVLSDQESTRDHTDDIVNVLTDSHDDQNLFELLESCRSHYMRALAERIKFPVEWLAFVGHGLPGLHNCAPEFKRAPKPQKPTKPRSAESNASTSSSQSTTTRKRKRTVQTQTPNNSAPLTSQNITQDDDAEDDHAAVDDRQRLANRIHRYEFQLSVASYLISAAVTEQERIEAEIAFEQLKHECDAFKGLMLDEW